MMENQGASTQNPTAPQTNSSDPFAGSASAMFNDFERVRSQEGQNAQATGAASGAGPAGADLPPGMNDGDLNNLEKQFMGMFQNITKQMENFQDDDDDDEDDENLTEEEKKEAEQMMKNLFGAMGVDPGAANPMAGMPGMPTQPPNQ